MAAKGEKDQITRLAELQGEALHRFLASRLRSALNEVPDLAQEVFLRLLRVSRPDTVRSPEAYLFGIARHVLHQHRAQVTSRPETVAIEDVLSELTGPTGLAPDAEIEARQRIEAFHRALSRLPPNVYATLMLNRVAGLTLAEVAARLGVSRGMAKKYLLSALEVCRECEDEHQGGGV